VKASFDIDVCENRSDYAEILYGKSVRLKFITIPVLSDV
jgi:hypothetical protein